MSGRFARSAYNERAMCAVFLPCRALAENRAWQKHSRGSHCKLDPSTSELSSYLNYLKCFPSFTQMSSVRRVVCFSRFQKLQNQKSRNAVCSYVLCIICNVGARDPLSNEWTLPLPPRPFTVISPLYSSRKEFFHSAQA